jgi:hypothetical protein
VQHNSLVSISDPRHDQEALNLFIVCLQMYCSTVPALTTWDLFTAVYQLCA